MKFNEIQIDYINRYVFSFIYIYIIVHIKWKEPLENPFFYCVCLGFGLDLEEKG